MKLLKKTFSERNLVIILFVLVLITFSFAQRESSKLDKIYIGFKIKTASPFVSAEKQKPLKSIPAQKVSELVN
jgi:hypothetical protein